MEKSKKPIYKKWWFWVIVIIIIGAIGAEASPDTTTSTSSSSSTTSVKTSTEKFKLVSDEMTNDGFSTYIEGTIQNNTDKKYSYVQVTFNLYDSDGNQLGTAMDNINNLEPNGTWKYKAIGLTTENIASYKFVEITGW